MSVLNIQNLKVSYQNQPIIKNLNLQIEPGEIVALFGPSGGGKSTVLKAVAGLLEEVSGLVTIGETLALSDKLNLPTEKRNVGLIFQDYALFPHLTVEENVAFGLGHLSKTERLERVTEMLALIKLSSSRTKYPHQLSGGQQQRIAIVRALACKPNILLFDEAFSNIDPQFRFELIADIRMLLKDQNTSALFVTHNQDEAFAFCDRIAVLNAGRIEQIDTAERLFNYPRTRFVAEFLGEGLWLRTQVASAHRLSSELGDIAYCGESSIESMIGKYVDIYLRPHHLRLELSLDSSIKVTKERFVGQYFEATIEWFGQSIKVRTVYSFLNKAVKIKVDTNVSAVFLEQSFAP